MASLLMYFFLAILIFQSAYSKEFGNQGLVYSIDEENIISYLEKKYEKLSDKNKKSLHKDIQTSFVNSFSEPSPVKGIREAEEYNFSYFDPSVIIRKDIKDHTGKVIVASGTRVNPLDKVSLGEDLLFFDGTKEAHISWAKAHKGKWILVKGKPLDLEKDERRAVYFDQFGLLRKKLSIKRVPLRVSQEGKRLKLEEIPVGRMEELGE